MMVVLAKVLIEVPGNCGGVKIAGLYEGIARMGTLLASFWYSYRNSERIAFRFLYSLGVIPCDSLKTLLKCGTSLNPTAKQISDICFCECFSLNNS